MYVYVSRVMLDITDEINRGFLLSVFYGFFQAAGQARSHTRVSEGIHDNHEASLIL